jgi:hypothetical protein
VRSVLQRNVKLGNVRDQMFAALVRPMLEQTKRTIHAEDVQGVKALRKLGLLLSELHTGGTERDRAGNRKRVHELVMNQCRALILLPDLKVCPHIREARGCPCR